MFVQNSLSVSARQATAIRNSFSLQSDVFSLLLYAADKVMQQMMMASTKITFLFIVLSSFYYCFFELPLVIVFFMAKLQPFFVSLTSVISKLLRLGKIKTSKFVLYCSRLFVTLQQKTDETNEKNFSITFIGRGHNDDGADRENS